MKQKLVSSTVATLLTFGAGFAWQQGEITKTGSPPPPVPVTDTKGGQTAPPATTAPPPQNKPATTAKPTAGKNPFPAAKPKPAKPPKPAWQEFKLNGKTTMFLDFTDTNPDTVISIFSRSSGITILKDPQFKTPITVTSAKSVGLNEAFDIFNTVLEMNGYTLKKKGNMLLVSKNQPPQPPPMMAPPQPPAEEKSVLKVYRLKFAGAQQVARVINEVFSQQQLETMIQQLQQGGGFGIQPNPFGGGGRPQPPKVVRASSDDFGNAVVVTAPEKYQADVETLINQLDQSSEAPLKSQIFRLKYVQVDEIVDAIKDVLAANAPTGRGGGKSSSSQDNNPFYGYYPYRQQSSRTSNAQTAVAIRQTNSVIVSATDENMTLVKKLLDQIDTENGFEGTTFVIKLENARASDVADLLNKAFTKRRDQNNDNPFFFIYDSFGDQNNKKQEVTTDITEDGRLVNVRDLTGKVNIMADPNTNSLIVVTQPSNMKLIRNVVNQIDRVPDQVMIETVIVEANLGKDMKLGVEWNFLNQGSRINQTGNTNFTLRTAKDPLEGFRYTLTGPDYRVFLNALQTDTRFKVLSTPRIFTSNNVKAEINVSQQVPYITSQQSGNIGGLISNYDFKNVGVVLTVTPRITAAGEVAMDVIQSADDLQGFTDFNAPIINHRQASTTATVKDGETIVLGGIIRNTVNITDKKIPLLGDIPLIGQLFRSSSRENRQTELMVLLTPHIVRNNKDAQKIREDQTGQLSKPSQDSLKNLIPPSKDGGV